MNNNLIFLDTHILLWSLIESEKVSKETRKIIDLAQKENRLAICSISLWEIAMLNSKNRINVFEPIKNFLESIAKINGLSIKDISPETAAESVLLTGDFHGDPADRIIVASTRVYGATLITKDQKILDWAKNGHLKVID